MIEEPQGLPQQAAQEVSGKAVAALVFSLLGIVGWCPCIGSILGVALGVGESHGVGKAAVIIGWIGIGLMALFGAAFAAQILLVVAAEGF